ncbi:GNAT family N-acetyltransferase [bacterium CPR1]|nr:GNAT family N-acetyltransferase [bacterium CPR1]
MVVRRTVRPPRSSFAQFATAGKNPPGPYCTGNGRRKAGGEAETRRAIGGREPHFPLVTWNDRLSGAGLIELERLVERCQQADRSRCLSEELLLRLRKGTGDTWASWVPGAEGWSGYAQLHLTDQGAWGELLVDPSARRRGLGRHLLDACVQSARERGANHLDVWCFGDHEGGARLSRSLGFAPLRRLLFLVRGLDSLPPLPASPVGLEPFEGSRDVSVWMALHRSVQPDPTRAWSEDDLQLRLAEPWFDPSLLRLARLDGQAVGYLWLKHHALQTEGELFRMAVAPAMQGRGLGRYLVTWALHELAWRRALTASVFVSTSNEAACRLYQGLGFRTHASDCCYRRELVAELQGDRAHAHDPG